MLEHHDTFNGAEQMSIDDLDECCQMMDAWQEAELRASKKPKAK